MSSVSFSRLSLTFTPLLPGILNSVASVGMLTDQSFVRSPSTTSRSFYRWTRRYWADSAPVGTTQKCSLKNCFVLTSLSGSSQDSWASDLSRVREFLMGYMRGGPQPEPMLQLDEVKHCETNTCAQKLQKETFSYLTVWSCYFMFLVPDVPVL